MLREHREAGGNVVMTKQPELWDYPASFQGSVLTPWQIQVSTMESTPFPYHRQEWHLCISDTYLWASMDWVRFDLPKDDAFEQMVMHLLRVRFDLPKDDAFEQMVMDQQADH